MEPPRRIVQTAEGTDCSDKMDSIILRQHAAFHQFNFPQSGTNFPGGPSRLFQPGTDRTGTDSEFS